MTITQLHGDGLPPRAELFARRVRGFLAEEGLDQAVIQEALDVSPSSASRRVRGMMEFGLGEMDPVAEALGTTVEYLLGLTDDRGPGPTQGQAVRAADYWSEAKILPFPGAAHTLEIDDDEHEAFAS